MSKRNMSIELMRCCMMFGIVLLHIITQDHWFEQGRPVSRHFINILSPCVEGFVFISGYFGIKCSAQKIGRLLGLYVLYRLLFSMSWGLGDNWFLFGYVVLMMLAPVVNAAFEGKSSLEVIRLGLPIVIAVYGWSYLCVIPWTKPYIPRPYGFAPLSFFTMLGIYTAARMFRILDIETKISFRLGLGLMALSAVVILGGFHHHNSPASFVFVACLFSLMKRMNLSLRVDRLVGLAAPSMFGVFILHSTSAGKLLRREIIDVVAPAAGVWASYFVTAAAVFCGCCAVDVLRRVWWTVISNFLNYSRHDK